MECCGLYINLDTPVSRTWTGYKKSAETFFVFRCDCGAFRHIYLQGKYHGLQGRTLLCAAPVIPLIPVPGLDC